MDVSAIITTSMTDSGVIGAFAVPANSTTSAVAAATIGADQAAWMWATGGSAVAASGTVADEPVYPSPPSSSSVGNPGSGPGDSPGLLHARGTTLLTELSALSRSQLQDFVGAHPEAVSQLLASPPAAVDVASWWRSADATARADLTSAAPQLVGNLEGVPYPVRAVANQRYLDDSMASVRSQLDTAGRATADDLRAKMHMLEQVRSALGEDADAHLIGLDTDGTGRAIIAIGDLTRADYVSYLVPGMFYTVDAEIASWTHAASDLATDQRAWLARLRPGAHETVATVAWIGYQAPTLVDVASMDQARDGSVALTASLHGLAATRASAPYVSILTHSYGATVALLSLQNDDVSVDALAMVGSPGSPAQTVDDLKVQGGNVWVAQASLDPVSDTGVFGSQPLSASYGAQHFGVTGAVDPVTGDRLAGSVGHVDYFTSGSESFRNMALIGIGQGALVLDPDGHSAALPRSRGAGVPAL